MLKFILLALSFFIASSVYAGFDEGMAAYNSKDYAIALKEWQPLAKNGDSKALRYIGVMYENGYGVKKNDAKAMEYYRKAAEQAEAASKSADQGNELVKKDSDRIEAKQSRVEQIGQKICQSVDDVTMRKPGYIGEATYKGQAKLIAFVEGYTGTKIQIRISGLNFEGRLDAAPPYNLEIKEAMNNFNGYKGSNLQIGTIIWDDYSHWSPCEVR